jgi:hypothetical protein
MQHGLCNRGVLERKYMPNQESLARHAADGAVAALEGMGSDHDCVKGYWDDWTWKCIPATRNMVYKWSGAGGQMSLEYVKPRVYPEGALGGKVERASLFHLHGWKGSDKWEYQEDGWKAPVVRAITLYTMQYTMQHTMQ